MKKNVKSFPRNMKWFEDAAFLVSYTVDSDDETVRIFVIDFVPGRFWKFFGWKDKRRIFKGAGVEWREIVNEEEVSVNETLSNVLCAGYIKNENKVRILRKASRRKDKTK